MLIFFNVSYDKSYSSRNTKKHKTDVVDPIGDDHQNPIPFLRKCKNANIMPIISSGKNTKCQAF